MNFNELNPIFNDDSLGFQFAFEKNLIENKKTCENNHKKCDMVLM